MTAHIVTENLTKTYGRDKSPALDALTIDIKAGEVYGYLGANGAGKSTTIRLLMNFLKPTSGSATICGFDVVKDSVAVKKHVGYLAGDVALYPKVTGQELLNYLADMQSGVDRSYSKKLAARFEADLFKPIGDLSKGNRQKIGILQAFMHQPDVLILDEPTSGLDPLMQEAFYDSVREARGRGAAILMSSHNLVEAQKVCDRIGIIKHGKLIREQAAHETDGLTKPVFNVTLATVDEAQRLSRAKTMTLVSKGATETNLILRAQDDIAAALAELSRYSIRELTTQQPNLEDKFLEFYEDKS